MNRYGLANVGPICDLMNGKNIAGLERNIRVWIGSRDRSADWHRGEILDNPIPVPEFVAGEVGAFHKRIALEPSCHAHQLRSVMPFDMG